MEHVAPMRTAASGRNLTFSLVEAIGQAIVAGAYDAKPFPTEAELSLQFKVGRSATREAVKMLTAKGLLRARQRQGTQVEPESRWNLLDPDVLRWMLERKLSPKLLSDFTEMRLAIEPIAAALAAVRADAAGINGIRRGIERMQAAERGEDDPLAADIAFHVAILHATRNPFYHQLEEMVNTALRISIRFTNQIKGAGASLADHERVFEAILARDPERAREGMHKLVNDALDVIREGAGFSTIG